MTDYYLVSPSLSRAVLGASTPPVANPTILVLVVVAEEFDDTALCPELRVPPVVAVVPDVPDPPPNTDSDKAAEPSSPPSPPATPIPRPAVWWSGCPGCVGSDECVREAPNRSWASVESITVSSQSHVGLRWYSRYNCDNVHQSRVHKTAELQTVVRRKFQNETKSVVQEFPINTIWRWTISPLQASNIRETLYK